MKAADIFSSLLAEPATQEGAATKDATAAAGVFDAVLAEAVDQDAAKQEGQAPAEAKAQVQQTEQTVAREQTIVVPSGPLSIHGSISRALREKVVAPQRDALASASLELPAGADSASAAPRGESLSGESVQVAETEASATDYEHQDESAAMQNVLGHVAAAIARIVAPSEPQTAGRPTPEASQHDASAAGDAQHPEGARAHARAFTDASSASRLARNEVVLEQPEALAGETFALPREGGPLPSSTNEALPRSPGPHDSVAGAHQPEAPSATARAAAEQAPSVGRQFGGTDAGAPRADAAASLMGAGQAANADPASQSTVTMDPAQAAATGAREAAPDARAGGHTATRFAGQRDAGRAAYAAQGQQGATRAQALPAAGRGGAMQALATNGPNARAAEPFAQQSSGTDEGLAPRDAVRVRVEATEPVDPSEISAAGLPARSAAGAGQSEQPSTTRHAAGTRDATTTAENVAARSNALAGAAFASTSPATGGSGTSGAASQLGQAASRAPLSPSGQAQATNSAAMQRAQRDRDGVRFEPMPELTQEGSAPAVQVTFAKGAEEIAASGRGNASAATRSAPTPGAFARVAPRADASATGGVSAPSANAGAAQTAPSSSAAQTQALPAAARVAAPPSGTAAVQARPQAQGAPVQPASATVTMQPAPAQAAQQAAGNTRPTSVQAAPAQGTQQAVDARVNQGEVESAPGTFASTPNRDAQGTAAAGASRAARAPVNAGNIAVGRGQAPASHERNDVPVENFGTGELEPTTAAQPRGAEPAPAQAANAANTTPTPQAQPRAAAAAPLPAAQPTQAVPVAAATPQLEQAAVAAATTREEQAGGDKPRAAKGAADPMARVEGFSRGARFGAALSAYSGRGHDNAEHDTRGKRSEEREREFSAEKSPAETFTQAIDQSAMLQQPTPTMREAPAPELAARTPAVPVAVPVPEQADIEFSRPPIAQPQNASISLHHPDLGPIQIQVQRLQDRVEVSAVIESAHAEAVLRANESGIRIGVQQSGMTFGALKVKLRGQDRERGEKDNARPGQERRRRGIERGI